jgi:hypothetical protein
MVMATRRICGKAAVQGVGHAALSGLAAGAAATAAGLAVTLVFPVTGKLVAVGVAVIAASSAVIAFTVVAYLLDQGDARKVLSWLNRLPRPHPRPLPRRPRSGQP